MNTVNSLQDDERNQVELPLLKQLDGLDWNILDFTKKSQTPADTGRNSFTEVILPNVLRTQLQIINPWLEVDQIEEVVTTLTASFPSNNLIENNKHLLNLLLQNTSVSENRKTGERSPSVQFIDFQSTEKNDFTAICQFKVRILGSDRHIIPDIICFVNGLPLVVIECKSPKIKDPIAEAIDQLLRYSEQRTQDGDRVKEEGNQSLFYYNQFIIVTCRNECKFGTITTHIEKLFYRWADPYPRSINDLEYGETTPNDQQRLVAGMLDHRNLLDIIRTFTLFSTNDKGQTIKLVGRYQQFRAVKLAVKRLLEGKTPRDRSGIIWHTQGSGKSLTMMFMVREMYRHAELSQWKVVFITDRTQLEEQLAETSQSIGYTVKIADRINPENPPKNNSLKELLSTDTADLVMAMIHKFRETELQEIFPELNPSPYILVMTDEAHRSQYSLLGSNLDKAIPNAARIGYTGTPIDKTERVFGEYIDKYTMRQAIADKVTLEIVYEGRTHNAEITDRPGMDMEFADVFSDYNLEERLQILGYGSRQAYLEAESTIQAKAQDMVEHYLTHVFPNGFKAQIVATSREAAVRYKKQIDAALVTAIAKLEQHNPNQIDLDRLKTLETDVIISAGSNNDRPHLKEYTHSSRHEISIKRFKMPFDREDEEINGNIGILIVNNMLLTGFDAPIEQVLYLDKVIIAHNLLQAIARVNRVGNSGKDKGFVVDYVGIGHHLKKAIDNYDEREQKEILAVLSFPEQELRDLEASHAEIIQFLKQYGLTLQSDLDAFYDLFYDEDIRFDYMQAFRQFTRCLNVLYPAKEALTYLADYEILTAINARAAMHLRDGRISMKDVPPKLRAIADVYLQSQGINVKVQPISILDENFEQEVGKHKRTKTKAAEIAHAIRHHLNVDLIDDPDLQASFAATLAQIFEQFKDNWNKIYEELEKLRERIRSANQEPTYGLHRQKQMPFFRCLKREIYGEDPPNQASTNNDTKSRKKGSEATDHYTTAQEEEQIAILVDLTQQIYLTVERELKLTGFWDSIPARNKLKAELQQVLLAPRFTTLPQLIKNRTHIISRIMEIAEAKNDTILYAE